MRSRRVAALAMGAAALTGCTHQIGAPAPTAASTTSAAPSPTPLSTSPTSPSHSAIPSTYADTPGARVIADMLAAITSATSAHYFGSLDQAGNPVDVDMKVSRAGATGTVDYREGRVELLRAGDALYLRTAAPVWRAQGVTDARALKAIAGKWVLLPVANAARFRIFTDVDYLISGFKQPSYAVTGTRVIAGVPAVELRDATGTVLTVASGAPHVPLTITNAAGKGSLTFTNWNAPLVVHAPAGAVDLAKLSRS